MDNTTDPWLNAHIMYDAQDEAAEKHFEEQDWDGLTTLLASALGDPFLPRYFRAKYHILSIFISTNQICMWISPKSGSRRSLPSWRPTDSPRRQLCSVQALCVIYWPLPRERS
ncbi:Hypothetical protein D9617_54g000140 [Elsinoe fawcettii]|nr:Hypothetical protein D9617_54g000140 [Elsinoe fawcettii]